MWRMLNLTAPTTEKVWTVCGPESGPDQGKKALIVRALYGLKGSGVLHRNHISDCMRHLQYEPCKADPDLWMKPMTRPEDDFQNYAYVLIYVEDILAVSHDALGDLNKIDLYFKMKKGSIGFPDIYLGSRLRSVVLPNGVKSWLMSPTKYVAELSRMSSAIWKRIMTRSCPSVSSDLYQPTIALSLILQRNWWERNSHIVALPQKGHLEAVFYLFAYLRKKQNGVIVLDPTYPEIDLRKFNDGVDWKNIYCVII
jgi:hypothetical protein